MRSAFTRKAIVRAGIALGAVLTTAAWAQENPTPQATSTPSGGQSDTPFIDSIKQKMQSQGHPVQNPGGSDAAPDPYIQSLKKRMKDQGTPPSANDNSSPFIDSLKSKDPSLNNPPPGQDYTQKQQQTLPPKDPGGAIAAVNEGHSDLHMIRSGEIKNLFAIKVGTFYNRGASAPSTITSVGFAPVYGSGYAPDVRFEGERYLIRGEDTWSFGIMAYTGIEYFAAQGIFAIKILQPDGVKYFPPQSLTRFAFVNLPFGVGPSIRLNYLKWFRPYVQVMPTASAFFESRNDGIKGHRGLSAGFTENIGMAIGLDWISKDTTWALYRDYGIKRVYFTADYNRYDTPLSSVDFQFGGLTMGFSFEF